MNKYKHPEIEPGEPCPTCEEQVPRPTSLEDRFWYKTDVKGKHDCWMWTGATKKSGYGVIQENHKVLKAHRVSWEIHNGEIPEGLFVLHQCDQKSCVNPNHLYLGNHLANVRDSIRRNPYTYKASDLTSKDVKEIRERYEEEDISQSELARQYGVSQPSIYKIVNNLSWKYV